MCGAINPFSKPKTSSPTVVTSKPTEEKVKSPLLGSDGKRIASTTTTSKKKGTSGFQIDIQGGSKANALQVAV